MAVSSLSYFSPFMGFMISECNNFAHLRVEMLFLHYVNDLLKFLLMRCSFVPFIPFLLEGGFVIPVIKWLLGLSILLTSKAVFDWSPFEISVFNRFKVEFVNY